MRRIEVTTYFLEMATAPRSPAIAAPSLTEVVPAKPLSASEYRRLYESVGAPWLWYERCEIADEALQGLIDDKGVSIYLLRHRDQTAGYTELRYSEGETQILYFGLKSSFIGAGLGRYFLDWTVRKAFSRATDRLWVHTCSLDHERALATYRSVGFNEYRQESGWVRIPQSALDRQALATAAR